MAVYRAFFEPRRLLAPPERPAGAAGHLPRQRRPRGEPCPPERRQRPDPRRYLPGVDVLVAVGAGPGLGDATSGWTLSSMSRITTSGRSRPGALAYCGPPAIEPRSWSAPRSTRRFVRYFAAGETLLPAAAADALPDRAARRPEPKRWVRRRLRPCEPAPGADGAAGPASPAPGPRRPPSGRTTTCRTSSTRLWLGPSMSYSSGMWTAGTTSDLDAAEAEKVAFFADRLGRRRRPVARCGLRLGRRAASAGRAAWRGRRRRTHAQRRHRSRGSASGRCRGPRSGSRAGTITTRHERYDAIMSFGAFEHFARDGTTGDERVARLPALLRALLRVVEGRRPARPGDDRP